MIQTNKLYLDQLSLDDSDNLLNYAVTNSAHLMPWEPLRPEGYYELETFRAMIKRQTIEIGEGRAERFVMRLRDDPSTIVGVINFTNLTPLPFLAANLGYSIAQRFQGQSLMTEALTESLNHMLKQKKLHRIMANYMPKNHRSAAILRKLGFAIEGYARSYLKIAGHWEDHVLTSFVNYDD